MGPAARAADSAAYEPAVESDIPLRPSRQRLRQWNQKFAQMPLFWRQQWIWKGSFARLGPRLCHVTVLPSLFFCGIACCASRTDQVESQELEGPKLSLTEQRCAQLEVDRGCNRKMRWLTGLFDVCITLLYCCVRK